MTRKQIEDYYNVEWKENVSSETLSLLVELTCKEYKLHKPEVPDLNKNITPQRPHNLGQI